MEPHKILEPVLSFHILDVYSFRNYVLCMKMLYKTFTFVFTKLGFSIVQRDAEGLVRSSAQFVASELFEYHLNAVNENGEPVDELNATFDISKFYGALKDATKKDSIIIYFLAEYSRFMISIGTAGSRDGRRHYYVPIENNGEIYTFEDVEYQRAEANPNIKVAIQDFSKLCTRLNVAKCVNLKIEVYPNRFECVGIGTGNFSSSHTTWHIGNPDLSMQDLMSTRLSIRHEEEGDTSGNESELGEEDSSPIVISIKKNIFKAFAKIHALAQQGLIKIIVERGKPMKFWCPIGYYGSLVFHIYNENETE
jgi:hypothetical protein